MSSEAQKSTTDGLPPRPGHETDSAPAPINASTGQHGAYWILSAEERAKGFVRPVRLSYRHVGIEGPLHPLRDLSDEERQEWKAFGWVKFEAYPSGSTSLGRYWSQRQLWSVGAGCGTVTTMSRDIAETYAREPGFYGQTFCVNCRDHLPVGRYGEFVWVGADGADSVERVGT